MQLGANFVRGSRESIHFNIDAVRALRPACVRLVLSDPENAGAWAIAARGAGIKVLWCMPVEQVGYGAARLAVSRLVYVAGDVSAGLELGNQPRFEFDEMAKAGAGYHFAQLASLASLAGGRLGPVLLGLGYDGSGAAYDFTQAMLRVAVGRSELARLFAGLTCRTLPGRPLGRVLFRAFADQVRYQTGWRLAFTYAGWQLGEELGAWCSLRETLRALWRDGVDACEVTRLRAAIRDRWLAAAFEHAWALGASHFVLASRNPYQDGVNAWAGYDSLSGRPDGIWTRLNWKASQLAPETSTAAG